MGNYVVERPLKRGAMGSVYLATHQTLGREVAIKFLDAKGVDGNFRDRFLAEARITAAFRHPHIVDLFDFGEVEGNFYHVMELLRGCDLADRLEKIGSFTPGVALPILEQVCEGLAAAHRQQIVHRDLKPANIFLCEGEPELAKLMDFGVAKMLSAETTGTTLGQLLGTPAYMAPEQAAGDQNQISPQTDLYAWGVIAYQMLSGTLPFTHQSPMMMLVAHIHDPCPPLRERCPHLPSKLCDLVDSCLRKDPQQRPGSAQELQQVLAQLLDEQQSEGVPSTELAPAAHTPGDLSESQGSTLPATRPSLLVQPAAATSLSQGPGNLQTVLSARDTSQPPPERRQPLSDPAAPTRRSLSPGPEVVTRTVQVAALSSTQPPRASSGAAQNAPCLDQSLSSIPAPPLTLPSLVPDPQPKAELLEPAIPPPSSKQARSPAPDDLCLDDEERSTLRRLLARMKRRGDLPAFLTNIGDVNKRADFDGKYSAEQLSEAILRDHALTAKLLRVVNTTYIQRFGGKIFSVQQAIVILGFEEVRSIALGIAVFVKSKEGANAARMADSSVHSLVSGEIARALAPHARVEDEELATVCAMFCNLGRHLCIVYLPEQYDQVLDRAGSSGLGLEKAAELELGMSFQKLGVGIAEQWHLPERVMASITTAVDGTRRLATQEQRVAALARLSNDLCELVAQGVCDISDERLLDLLASYSKLVDLKPSDYPELLGNVEEVFRHRYASLLGRKATRSRFLQKLPDFSPRSNDNRERGEQAEQARKKLRAQAAEEAKTERDKKRAERGPSPSVKERKVHALQLGRPLEDAGPLPDLASVLAKTADKLGLHRLIALAPTAGESELRAICIHGTEAELLQDQLVFSLGKGRQNGDVFSRTYRGKRDTVLKDAFARKSKSTVPRRYYEVLGSPAFLLLVCQMEKQPTILLLADVDDCEDLPIKAQLGQLDDLRRQAALAAANR